MADRTAGHWIAPDGRLFEVVEHFEEVSARPRLFGFRPGEAAAWTRADRDRVLLQAVARGWIRVRGHRDHTTFDTHELTGDAIFRIKDFLQRTRAWENERVMVYEHARRTRFEETAGAFLRDELLAAARNARRRRRGRRRR